MPAIQQQMHINKPDSTSLMPEHLGQGKIYLSEGWKGGILKASDSQLSAPKPLSTAIVLPPAVFPNMLMALTPQRSHSSRLQSPATVHWQDGDIQTTEETIPAFRACRKPRCSGTYSLMLQCWGQSQHWTWARTRHYA